VRAAGIGDDGSAGTGVRPGHEVAVPHTVPDVRAWTHDPASRTRQTHRTPKPWLMLRWPMGATRLTPPSCALTWARSAVLTNSACRSWVNGSSPVVRCWPAGSPAHPNAASERPASPRSPPDRPREDRQSSDKPLPTGPTAPQPAKNSGVGGFRLNPTRPK
jgi:hypothetical protein